MSNLPTLIRQNKFTLQKTVSYYFMHVIVAIAVAYVVTGDWAAALALSLLEPSVQAVAFFIHEKSWSKAGALRWKTWLKTGTYYVLHIFVAAGVAYTVTQDFISALTLSLVEPTVQMVCYFFHEKAWSARQARCQQFVAA